MRETFPLVCLLFTKIQIFRVFVFNSGLSLQICLIERSLSVNRVPRQGSGAGCCFYQYSGCKREFSSCHWQCDVCTHGGEGIVAGRWLKSTVLYWYFVSEKPNFYSAVLAGRCWQPHSIDFKEAIHHFGIFFWKRENHILKGRLQILFLA